MTRFELSARRLRVLLAATVAAVLVGGCSAAVAGSASADRAGPAASADPTIESAAAPADDTAPTLPPGASPGQDDFNDDGVPEPTCGTHDYGAGLVLQVLCDAAAFAQNPNEDTVLVPDSLFGQPNLELDLTGISGDAETARDADGRKRVLLFISSDTLFATGSAALSDPARTNFDAIARLIASSWPGAPVEIRGHTDATGSPAANQRLSEQRAVASADYLGGHGLDRARITTSGLGSTVPIVLETNPDGSPNPAGQTINRRVEIVITAG
jgi:outer membrane protein OmpA-like peptidoglycan-associated protein